ncbi:hypothetical protein NK122_003253 [Escherichia coli]|uniref:hypothetical protein n=1 Tax=Escherichia coli TaxID=562 RepID=UPI00164FDD44|nr:hypothetical protein [Escherichia coli O51]EHP2004613.1 hypothetical protein [Escherichia coli]EHY5870886.1 hypothetical protein [Escherichia coli]EIF7380135.1 hypothetical protein [Escherichia coli]EIG3853948.1 hypothetical protein [Escherichia coli]
MSNFKTKRIECVALTDLGVASNCFTIGKIYTGLLNTDNNLMVIKDDNDNSQAVIVGVGAGCAFGVWQLTTKKN